MLLHSRFCTITASGAGRGRVLVVVKFGSAIVGRGRVRLAGCESERFGILHCADSVQNDVKCFHLLSEKTPSNVIPSGARNLTPPTYAAPEGAGVLRRQSQNQT